LLTSAGREVVGDPQFSAEHSSRYLTELVGLVPNVGPLVLAYLREALACYTAEAYMACAVMVGVAAEAAVLEVAADFTAWLPPGTSKTNLERTLASRQHYVHKAEEFRRRLENEAVVLPTGLRDGLSTVIHGSIDLIRRYRNDAGHPVGVQTNRRDMLTNLRVFAHFLERLYALQTHFRASAYPTQTTTANP
jgi:hypothetical protein